MTNSRWARFTRGWVVAAFSVFVAALSHSFAGGSTPSWLALALALAFASMLSIALSGGRARPASARSTGRAALIGTVFSVAGSQVIFHGLFSLLGTLPAQGTVVQAAALGTHSGHQLSPVQIATQLAAIAPQGTALPSGTHHDAWMLVGHTIAGLLTIAALLHGEQALRGLARTAGLALRGLAVRSIVITPITDAAPQRPASTVWIPRPLDVVHAALRHRGPPLTAAA
ncbi:hypothetical protein EV379_0249 [Microterricola gilva]|uniref:Uncharacterized protein n=1 Tax=Microterricola gilva TaxID=393267 RepID=A0A4Q8AHR9_9MICO|nr:hypothetical protein [Microterricola gilva]RZU63960.1 hypothetical protein EV379_0249 [Microterricola gilva]